LNDKLKVKNLIASHFTEGLFVFDAEKFPFDQTKKLNFITFRNDWDYSFNEYNTLSFGYTGYQCIGDINRSGYREVTRHTGTVERESYDYFFNSMNAYHAVYIQDEYEPVKDDLTLSYGLRSETMEFSMYKPVSPRAGLKKKIAEDTFLNASWGIFNRYELDITVYDKQNGNPDIKPEQAVHYILGLEKNISRDLRVKTDLFYKDYKYIVM
jgi:outer membrane receptor protein involved in Fe transport